MRDNRRILLAVLTVVVALTVACNMSTQTPAPATPVPTTLGGPAPALEITPASPLVTVEQPTPVQHDVFVPGVESGAGGEAGEAGGGQQVEPQVEIDPAELTLRVGETATVTGRPMGIGLPNYSLALQDEGVQDAQPVIEVSYSNESKPGAGSSQVIELVSAQGSMDQAVFVLRAIAAGVTTLTVNATGEVQMEDGGTTWGGGSGSLLITVTP